jgi:serine/threonine-protein kinase RsbW
MRFKYHPGAAVMNDDVLHVFEAVTLTDLGAIRRRVRETAVGFGCGPETAGELVIAVNEAVANIVRHGYGNVPGRIAVRISAGAQTIKITLLDSAPGFDPTQVPNPDTTLPLAERPFGGMGVHMMRAFCDEIRYCRTPDGENELKLLKHFAGPDD